MALPPLRSSHVVIVGGMVGADALTGLKFDPSKPHAGCGICGEVFQSDLDRLEAPELYDRDRAFNARQEWRIKHSRSHPDYMHEQLRKSGMFALPEAATKLAAFGIIPLTDTVRHVEVVDALFEAPRAPSDDAQGT